MKTLYYQQLKARIVADELFYTTTRCTL